MSAVLNDYYQTTDLSLSAVLSLFFPLWAIDRKDPAKVKFLFNRDEKLDEIVGAYWRGELKVEPLSYFNAIKNIKSRIHEEG
jgi:hypothetical protein